MWLLTWWVFVSENPPVNMASSTSHLVARTILCAGIATPSTRNSTSERKVLLKKRSLATKLLQSLSQVPILGLRNSCSLWAFLHIIMSSGRLRRPAAFIVSSSSSLVLSTVIIPVYKNSRHLFSAVSVNSCSSKVIWTVGKGLEDDLLRREWEKELINYLFKN